MRRPRPFIQREGVQWHCVARREIAERSEEAPAAIAAQPSRNVGSWKTQAGCFGGDARGAEKGAQPHNRPRLAPAGGGQTTEKEKPPCPQGTETTSQRTNPALFSSERSPRMPPAPHPPPEAAQTTNKKGLPCPQGTKATSQRTSPALFSSERSPRMPPTPPNKAKLLPP